jgi:hypothetical protein
MTVRSFPAAGNLHFSESASGTRHLNRQLRTVTVTVTVRLVTGGPAAAAAAPPAPGAGRGLSESRSASRRTVAAAVITML